MTDRIPLDHLTSDQYDELCNDLDEYERVQGDMNERAIDLTRRAETAEQHIKTALALHQPMQRGPFTICAHCSGWDGRRCLGVVTEHPCPTVTALTEPEDTLMTDETSPEQAPEPSEAQQFAETVHTLQTMVNRVREAVADETLSHGCTINGQPAMPILVTEYNQLIARLAEAEGALVRPGLVPDDNPATDTDPVWAPPPPGDKREQLPDALLALIDVPPYTSTACEAATLLARQMPKHTHRRVELGEHSDRLHARCRLQNKFTGVACRCDCHA